MKHDSPDAGPRKAGRYQMLDVWRGVVCLVVILEHAGVALWGGALRAQGWDAVARSAVDRVLGWNLGSPLFFVMSGYCVASCLDSARRRGTPPLEFFVRRLWRIFPTYWAALFGFVVLAAGLDALGLAGFHRNGLSLEIASPGELNTAQWLGNLTLTETWRPRLGGGFGTVYTRVAWSLCYQEQFYAVCVLALWLAPGRLERALAAATAGIAAYALLAWDAGATQRCAGLFPAYWHVFAVGLAVYWRLNQSVAGRSRFGVECGLAVLMALGCLHGDVHTWASAGFGLILLGLHRWDHLSAGLVWLAPLRALGRRSFSIYLTHLPVTTVGAGLLPACGLTGYWARVGLYLPAVTLASVCVGFAFYQAVERRFLGAPPLPTLAGRKVAAAVGGLTVRPA